MSGVRRLPDVAIDFLLLVALGGVTLAGLATSFTGGQFLLVGVLGLLVGAGLAVLTTARRWPFVAAVLLALVAFYLFGGLLALRSADAALPGPDAWGLLTDQVLYGWKDLLTTLPPLDGTGPLLVLPWFLGLAAGVLGMLLARVDRGPAWLTAPLPLLAPVALAAGVILIGIERPQSLLLQGSVFSVLALVWLGIRVRRSAGVIEGRGGRATRLAGASALVAVAGVLALPVGTWATGGDDRLILRDHVEPPFDIGQYASPLSSFRRYVEDASAGPANVYDDPLFEVDGLEAGTRVRIAALDTYDGVVWGAGADAVPGSTSDTFRRVSSEIHNPAPGDEVEAEVEIQEGYSGPWLPTVGALQELRFTEGDVEAKADSFRYNLATSTAVVPTGLRPGDRYTFRAAAEERLLRPEDSPASLLAAPVDSGFLAAQAVQWSAGESQTMAQVFAIADELRRTGKYSDGVANAERIYHAGHHVRRLGEEFANAPIMAGNDEQYAAVMALLANQVGVPARVVMGVTVPEDGVVHGRDVSAWVEVQVADGSWRTLPTDAFMDFDKPAETPPRTQEELSGKMVPPPAPIPPPSTAGEQTDAELNPHRNRRDDGDDGGFSLPAWLRVILVYLGFPLLVLAAIAGAIIGAKAWRRRRRRTHVKVSARFVGAWRELVDHARDLGAAVPTVGTRREQSLLLATTGAPVLARRADQHVFGPGTPAEDEASAYWEAVETERRAMSSGVPRWRRWLAAVDVRTFLRR